MSSRGRFRMSLDTGAHRCGRGERANILDVSSHQLRDERADDDAARSALARLSSTSRALGQAALQPGCWAGKLAPSAFVRARSLTEPKYHSFVVVLAPGSGPRTSCPQGARLNRLAATIL
jgi:hypothetical protein